MLEVIGAGLGIVGDFIKGKQQVQQAEIATKVAIEQNRAKLASDAESNNSAWEMAELGRTDTGLRRICFVILMSPFIVAMVDPVAVTNYFDTVLKAMPSWYINLVVSMVGAIWGLSYARTMIPSMIGGIMSAIRGGTPDNNSNSYDNSDTLPDNPASFGAIVKDAHIGVATLDKVVKDIGG